MNQRIRILILGGNGMIGSGLARSLSKGFTVASTVRNLSPMHLGYFPNVKIYNGINLCDRSSLQETIGEFGPQVVINAAGIVKQKITATDTINTIEMNSVFPHRLADLGAKCGFHTILLSTDCVFSGTQGKYTEQDIPDAIDLYGRSKILGEIDTNPNVLTLRISSIGLEIGCGKGLIEWFLAQKKDIRGYMKAIYTGFTSLELSRIIALVVEQTPLLSGLFHVSSEPISKYDLLNELKTLLHRNYLRIIPDTDFTCDRSLSSDKFRRLTGYRPPTWTTMLGELAAEINDRGTNI